MDQYYYADCLKVEPNLLTIFKTPLHQPKRSDKQKKNEKNLTRGAYNGFMSTKTRSRVRKYLGAWVQAVESLRKMKRMPKGVARPYLTFVTLTLPSKQKHTDLVLKRNCLAPFIQTLQRTKNVREYFWRAEPQENGNIHFHLIVDSYIDHKDLRDEWNKCTEKLEYVTDFCKKHGHRNPNSTDIHKLTNIENPAAYLIKYCLKNEGARLIRGRIHGCSDNVRGLEPYSELMGTKEWEIVEEAKKQEKAKIIEDECFLLIKCSTVKLREKFEKYWDQEIGGYYNRLGLEIYKKEASVPKTRSLPAEKKREVQGDLFNSWGKGAP